MGWDKTTANDDEQDSQGSQESQSNIMSDKSIAHAIAGGLSGLVSMAVTYPLVTLSTNAQTKTNTEIKTATATETATTTDTAKVENSVLDKASIKLPLRTVYQDWQKGANDDDGDHNDKRDVLKNKLCALRTLLIKFIKRIRFVIQHSKKYYAGLESALVGIVAVNFCYYYVYSLVGDYYKRKRFGGETLNVKDSLITGLTAGVISRIITNPIWVANTRMTVKKKNVESDDVSQQQQQNTLEVIKEIFVKEGIAGLCSGLGPALILVTSPMIQFTVFEQLKNAIVRLRSGHGITSFEALLLGSLGKLIAILATYPYYTIRSRMHVSKRHDENSFRVLLDICKEEGVLALYRGLDAKLLQSVISAGLIFYFKEELMNVVGVVVNGCGLQGVRLHKRLRSLRSLRAGHS